VSAGEHFDRLGQLRVAGDGAVMVAVGADQIGQHPRIPTVGLGPGGGMPLPVAASRQRVDPIDLVASSGQRADQQPPIGLDPNHHTDRVLSMVSDQLVQPSHALDPIRHLSGGQQLAIVAEHAHVVVSLGPVDPDKDHPDLLVPRPPCRVRAGQRRANGAALNLRRLIPPAIKTCPPTSQGTI
jgi:hypothetical protein